MEPGHGSERCRNSQWLFSQRPSANFSSFGGLPSRRRLWRGRHGSNHGRSTRADRTIFLTVVPSASDLRGKQEHRRSASVAWEALDRLEDSLPVIVTRG